MAPDTHDIPTWQKRFMLPYIIGAAIAKSNPQRGLAISNQQLDSFQLYAWDVPTGNLRRLTDHPGGAAEGWISAAGGDVFYLRDEGGNELGHLVRVPFEGGQPEDITPSLLPYTLRGVGFSRAGNRMAFNPINAQGFQVYCIDIASNGGYGAPRRIYQNPKETWGAELSAGGELVAVKSTERAGGMRQYSLLVLDALTGALIGELWDGPGTSVEPVVFSPVPGDERLLAMTNRSGFVRPVVWRPHTGERIDPLLPDLEGDIFPLDWDGERLLLCQVYRTEHLLHILHLSTGQLMRMDHPAGSYYSEFSQATWFAPNGAIHALWTDSTHPNEVIALDAQTGRLARSLLRSGDVPSGHPWRSVTFTSSDGQEVQGWLALPDGEGPFPTILNMHGGPHIAVPNVFSPTDQIWPDHGFAFLTINYRGSTSFGRQFQEKIWGDIGHWELEDMAAARRFLIEQGIARPDAILLNGASYGGFLTLLGLGRQPDLWAGGLALVAVADWLLDYEGASDALKGAARAWFGGPPEEKRQQYIASSPMTYAEAVRAPLLIIQGRNDTRTPARQMEQYEAKMKALGKDMQVLWFDAGHSGGDMGQIVGFLGQMVQFAQKVVNQ